MSSSGLEICKSEEGYATALPNGDCVAYWDKAGQVWTIGFGVTGPDVRKGSRWTREYAEERLLAEWLKHQNGVLRASPILLKHPNRLEAVTDFAYNEGVGRYQSSTLRRYVNQERWLDASREFPKWNLAGGKVQGGLVRRRQRERELFLLPDTANTIQSRQPADVLDTELADLSASQLPESSIASQQSQRTQILPEAPQLSRESPSFATRLGEFFRNLW
jgi:lysozyme